MPTEDYVVIALREETRQIASSVLEGFEAFDSLVSEKLAGVHNELDSLRERCAQLASFLEETEHDSLSRTRSLAHEFHSYVWLVSAGVDLAEARIQRYVPARLYLADPLPHRSVIGEIVVALENVLVHEQLHKAEELPPVRGSFWQALWFKTTELITRKDVQQRIQKVERAIEVAYLDKPQAEANEHQAKAASELIHALDQTSDACLQVGSLLVVKATRGDGKSGIMARTLTAAELKRLEENTEMLRRPEQILAWLQTPPQLPAART